MTDLAVELEGFMVPRAIVERRPCKLAEFLCRIPSRYEAKAYQSLNLTRLPAMPGAALIMTAGIAPTK
jgi:hypothetical protein